MTRSRRCRARAALAWKTAAARRAQGLPSKDPRKRRPPGARKADLEPTDMPLLRRAIERQWDVPDSLRQAVLDAAAEALGHESRLIRLTAARVIIAADLVDAKREATQTQAANAALSQASTTLRTLLTSKDASALLAALPLAPATLQEPPPTPDQAPESPQSPPSPM